MGIYQYLLENYKQLQIIDNDIECYLRFKNELKNS